MATRNKIIHIYIENNNNYNIWRKDIKSKKGVMIMINSRIKVINVEYEKGKTELTSAHIMIRCEETLKIAVAYVCPKTKN